MPCNATVVRWFLRRRGQALSISTSGGSFAAVLMPLLMGALVDHYSWRTLYQVMAAVVFAGLLIASVYLKASPEAVGLSIDGELHGSELRGSELRGSEPVPDESPAPVERSLTRSEAIHTRVFWILAGIFLCTWLVVFLPLVHLSPFARGLGASPAVAGGLVSAVGVGGLFGRTLTGTVSDRIGRVATLAIVLGIQVAAFLVFAVSPNLGTVYPAAALFGFGYGGTTTVFPAIVGDRFGRAHAGAIVGLLFAGAGSSAAVGPFMAAWIFDRTDSYRVAFLLSAAANGLGLALVAVLRADGRRANRGTLADAAPRPPGPPSEEALRGRHHDLPLLPPEVRQS